MCGIVGAATKRNVTDILLEGLQRLEYRGYDSAGLVLVDANNALQRVRRVGKVAELKSACQLNSDTAPGRGETGIAHTRWATHGKPTEGNAHPHVSSDKIAVVHNGIIENHHELRSDLASTGYNFTSETDTEVVAHLVHREVTSSGDFKAGVVSALALLRGAYAVGVVHTDFPGKIIAARIGSPLVIGCGIGENFIASDPQALRPVTDRFIYLEEGEIVEVTADTVEITGGSAEPADTRIVQLDATADATNKGNYRHYMMKEIHEQPSRVRETLEGRITDKQVLINAFGAEAEAIFAQTKAVQIVACGSSFYTGLVAKYWCEQIAGVPCHVEIASEFRYRQVAVQPNTLMVTISQSGETADTLAALRDATNENYLASLCLCNVPNSSLVRESDLCLMINAGPEICVASTKAFTNQLTDLLLLILSLAKSQGMSPENEAEYVSALNSVPDLLSETLSRGPEIKRVAEQFVDKNNALFLGRGAHHPVALEGALKLKEISYIHAEGYPAGELKHGPLALVDDNMPVVAVAPGDGLLEKVLSNLEEVRARGGQLIVFGDEDTFDEKDNLTFVSIPRCHPLISPIVYAIPMQLLSYHVAVFKGTDVDQPRNLAKSVTVE